MNLVGYTATALSRNDIEDTPTNKNVVDFAIVELKDLQGNLVVMYDDEEGANPETQKTCDTNGQVDFFAEAGDYNLEINGKAQRINLAANIADYIKLGTGESVQEFADSFALKIFQSPSDGGLTEIQTRTVNANEVYEVRKTSDDSLATIYSDAAGATEIVQNGTSNVSDSAGVVEFYIADGDYYIEVDGVKSNFTDIVKATNVEASDGKSVQDTHDAMRAMLIAQGLSGEYGFFAKGFDYVNVGDVGIDVDGKIYTYVGVGSPVKNVVAGTNPTLSKDYSLVIDENLIGIGEKLKLKLNANLEDATITVIGDSTGNEDTEWVYLLGVSISREYKEYTVQYHLWNPVNNAYDSPILVSSGLGSNVLNIYNASVAGADTYYWQGWRFNLANANESDLVIHSLGHNGGTSLSYDLVYSSHYSGLYQLASRHKKADLCVVLQNFRTDFEEYSFRAVSALKDIANNLGLTTIDVYSLFKQQQLNGDISDWMSDNVHPNNVGSRRWADLIWNSFAFGAYGNSIKKVADKSPEFPVNSDPYMVDFLLDDSKPAGATLLNCTTEESTEEHESGRSIKVTSNGSLGNIRFSASTNNILTSQKSGYVTFAVRVFVPLTNTSPNNGRIYITTNNGTYTSVSTGKGSWVWNTVIIPTSELEGTSYLRFHVFVDDGESIYIDRWCHFDGIKLVEPIRSSVAFTDYYYPENVAPQATTNLSVTRRDINVLDTSTGGEYRFVINIYSLTKNATYRVSYDSDVTQGGSIFVREGLNGVGTVIKTGTHTSGEIEFVSTGELMSLLITISTGNSLPRNFNNVEIKTIAAPF